MKNFILFSIAFMCGLSLANSDTLTYRQQESFKKCLAEYNDSQLCTELAILTDRSLASVPDDSKEKSAKAETATN